MEDFVKILADTPHLFRAMIDNIPSPVYYKDTRCVYIIYNKAFRDYFGITDEQLIGNDVFQLPIRREDAKMHHAMDLEILTTPGTRMYESRTVRNDGLVRYELIKKASFTGQDGKILGIVGVIMDISEQKRMEEDILKSKNLQSVATLAGGIAHDFNNLLMAIVGNLALAKLNTSQDSHILDYLNEAERITFLGKNLTQQLLAFSRGGNPAINVIRLDALLASLVPKLLHDLPVGHTFDVPEGIFPIEADEAQIIQVVENVVRNAAEATPRGGMITISLRNIRLKPEDRLPIMEEDFVRLSVKDNGKGILPENITKIFNPYFTTKSMGSEKGVGLGLAISHTIIKKHKGRISVESVEGKGSVVHIDLPAYKKQIMVETLPPEESNMRRNGRILLLDDEEMVLEIGKEVMEYLGYSVTTALSGDEALALYDQSLQLDEPFDAVILDLAIPGGMGGKEVIGALKRLDPDVKAIISSGYLTDPIVENYREYGFMGVLTKPYDSNELDDKLQKIIRRQ
ncbi:MAG: hybrid sensor histidine kinase/response regulator [Syntrophorhabdaceae bacterium]